MSIASQLTALEGNIEDAYDMVAQRGGTMPQRKNMENLDDAIATIPSGGVSYTAGTGIDITSGVISVDNTTVPYFSDLATVATTGDYGDLLNTPTIPAAQVNSDWNANSGVAQILNKPSLATVATSGDYDDLLNKPTIPAAQIQSDWTQSDNTKLDYIKNKPTIPTVNDATLTITQNGTTAGTFSANASSAETIALTDTTYSDMVGATSLDAGSHGLVPAPAVGDESKVLSGAGTWVAQTAAQVNSDWNSNSGVSQILNKPTIITPLDIYPVGAIYMSVNNTNPGTLFGGTWEQIKDRFILAAGTTYAGGATGGSATINIAHSHTVNSHNHSLPANTGGHTLTVDQIPAHTHAVAYQYNTGAGTARWGVSDNFGSSTSSGSTGGGKSHSHTIGGNTGDKSPGTNSQLSSTQSILPPYLAVYVWKRTA